MIEIDVIARAMISIDVRSEFVTFKTQTIVFVRSVVKPATTRRNDDKFNSFLGPKSNAFRSHVFGKRIEQIERRVSNFHRRTFAKEKKTVDFQQIYFFLNFLTVISRLNRRDCVRMSMKNERSDFISMSNEKPLLMSFNVHLNE